ncbi:MAG: putative signal peptide peptidase SppA [Gemmatimonadota bacterium]
MNRAALLAELSAERWLMEPRALEAMLSSLATQVAAADPAEMLAASRRSEPDGEDLPYALVDGVAHVAIDGTIMKRVPWFMRFFGARATSTTRAQAALQHAAENPEVRAIHLSVDSPGGTVAGTQELADTVFAARQHKPVVAHVSDLSASAAYWVASQASAVLANETAMVGSIGVYTKVMDASKLAEKEGVKVHVIRSGPHKGTGEFGSEVTPEQLAAEQAIVDDLAAQFVGAVARGRRAPIDAIAPLASGRVWIAPEARALGLIDAVSSADSARRSTVKLAGPTPRIPITTAAQATPRKDHKMSTENEMEALRAQLAEANAAKAKAEARAEAQAVALAETRKNQIASVIDAAAKAGRVTPALRPSVEKFAAALGTSPTAQAELEAFIAELPVQVRPQAKGVGGSTESAPSGGLSESDRNMAAKLGLSEEDFAKYSSAKGVTLDRKIVN